MILSRPSTATSRMPFCFWIMCVMSLISDGAILAKAASEDLTIKSPSGCHLVNKSLGIKAICTHLNLLLVPQVLPNNTVTLDLSYNKIATLHNKSFDHIPNIITLGVRYNILSRIEGGVFASLVSLKELSLENNHLASLPPGLFGSNRLLSILVLNTNRLTSIPRRALPESNSLTKLSLNNNKIYVINLHDFKPLQNCAVNIYLKFNALNSLPHNVFSNLTNVNILSLSYNALHEFHISSLSGKLKIKRLILLASKVQTIIPLNQSHIPMNYFPEIIHIDMAENWLSSLPNFTFWGLNQTSIVDLNHNRISTISNTSFCGLDMLMKLDLSRNHLSYLPFGMFSCNKLLQQLQLNDNKITIFSVGILSGLSSLNHLDLAHNNLQDVTNDISLQIPSLKYLDLSFNKFTLIKRFFLQGLINLKILDMSRNDINHEYSPYTFTKLKYLEDLYLTKEHFQAINTVFRCLGALLRLELSFSKLRFQSNRPFSNTSSLARLIMRENNLRSTDLFRFEAHESLFVGLTSLVMLDLRGNRLDMLNAGTFDPLKRLQSLLLSKSSIKVLNANVFDSLISLRRLDLSDNEISKIPVGLLQTQHKLSVLLVSNNKLEFIPKTLVNETSSLHSLYMQGNKISTIEPNSLFLTNGTVKLDVSRNPFCCTCDLSWFIQWLRSSNAELIHPEDTLCSLTSIKEKVDKPILSFHPDKYCGINIVMITSLSFSAVVAIAMCLVAYRRRWWFNYKFFLIKLAIFGYKEINQEFNADDYEYQLNLMYTEDDQDWVDQVMKPILEERFPHLQKVVFGDNDLNLWMFYLDALHHVVANSFKTVLLISYNSVDDAWFLTKLRIALEHLNDTRLDKIILMFREDIQDDDLPYLARLFLSKNKPFMVWTDDADGQELFWAQFEKSMRGNRVLNSVIPI